MELGLILWDKGIRDRFLQERAVAVVQRQEDETRDAILYRLANEIDVFLGVELSKNSDEPTKPFKILFERSMNICN